MHERPLPRFLPSVLVAALLSIGATAAIAQSTPATLPPAVAAALARAGVPPDALVAQVQEVGHTEPLLAWRVDTPVNPASVMKLLTTYAALDLLGPAWSWHTPVWLQASVKNGVLEGDLVIKGSGDPKLVVERLWLLLRRVRQLGVNEIRGDIVLDRTDFDVPEQDPGEFDGEALRPYNVGADALMLNFKALVFTFTPDPARGIASVAVDPPLAGVRVPTSVPLLAGAGCADWRGSLRADLGDALNPRFAGAYPTACGEQSWPIAYADPTHYNARAIAGMWQAVGGRLTGSVHDGVAPATKPAFTVASPPLAEVVRDINKYSNNVMAQQLFLTLALTQQGKGTPEAGRSVLRLWASDRLGTDATAGLAIANGSGLSREGRLSARLLARLLQSAWASPVMSELMSSLPVSGIDGTLKTSGAPSGRAHLKTGSLRDVVAEAGYVLAASGRRYVVVGIVNHPQANAARPALDALVQWAAGL